MFFHSCFSSLWHFHCSFLCFENGPWSWELPPGVFSRILFLSFILFRFCIVLAIFPSFALKIVLGNYQKEFFLESCRFFSFLYRFDSFWLCLLPLPWKLTLEIVNRNFFSNPFRFFSFIFMLAIFPHCLQNWPWELSKGAFSRTRFVFFVLAIFPLLSKGAFSSNPFRFFFPFIYFSSFAFKIDFEIVKKVLFLEPFSFFFHFGYFSSFAFKIDLGNCQKELFLEPFSCFFVVFFVLAIFPPLPSKSLEIIKDAFSRTLFFLFCFFRLCFVFSFWLFFLLCLQTLRIDVGL